MGIFTRRKPETEKRWFKLDNAAKIYPAVTNKVRTSVFRLSAELDSPIKPLKLQEALNITMQELPYFRTHLRKGFFWYWLEESESNPIIQVDSDPPCRTFDLQRRNHLLVRILARNSTISAEFCHILTDGGGGMQFLMRLLYHYGRLIGWDLDEEEMNPPINSEEYETLHKDAYVRHFLKRYPKPNKISKAFHLPLKIEKDPQLSILSFEIPSNAVKDAAKEKKVSITEYMAAIYLYTLQKFYFHEIAQGKKPKHTVLRVQIPVNLRKLYNSNTLRNFALFVMPEIEPRLGEYSFDEIISTVHHYMQLETDRRQIQRIISRNVGGERNPIIRIMPLIVKVPTLVFMFKNAGPLLYSGVLTNLGVVKVPDRYLQHVKSFKFIAPPPDPSLKINSAIISYNNRMILTFGNQTPGKDFEKEYIGFLINSNIPVKILTE